jgi:hypothetical protein
VDLVGTDDEAAVATEREQIAQFRPPSRCVRAVVRVARTKRRVFGVSAASSAARSKAGAARVARHGRGHERASGERRRFEKRRIDRHGGGDGVAGDADGAAEHMESADETGSGTTHSRA